MCFWKDGPGEKQRAETSWKLITSSYYTAPAVTLGELSPSRRVWGCQNRTTPWDILPAADARGTLALLVLDKVETRSHLPLCANVGCDAGCHPNWQPGVTGSCQIPDPSSEPVGSNLRSHSPNPGLAKSRPALAVYICFPPSPCLQGLLIPPNPQSLRGPGHSCAKYQTCLAPPGGLFLHRSVPIPN